MKDINRTKVVLYEEKRTNKWFKAPATVSKRCTNSTQLDLSTLVKIIPQLDVDVKDVIYHKKTLMKA